MNRREAAGIRTAKVVTVCILALTLVSPSLVQAQKDSNPLLFLFVPTASYSSDGVTDSIALGDVNGDGKPDLVAGNCSDISCNETGSVAVLLGNGDGNFQSAVVYNASGFGSNSIVLGDLNGDGKPDLVVVSHGSEFAGQGTGLVGVLLGNGNGTFQPVTTYNTNAAVSTSAALADVNGDGRPDLVVANCTGNCSGFGSVSVLLGNGDGTFQTAAVYNVFGFATGAWSVATGDFNGDGKLDLVVGARCGATIVLNCGNLVAVLMGNGDGTFQSPITLDSNEALQSSVSVADVNDDGKLDLLVANLASASVGVMLGNGDGTFQPEVAYDAHGWQSPGAPLSVAAADVNGDGKPDLLVGTGGVGVLLNNGDGTFQQIVDYNPPFSGPIAVGDVNGDGRPDVAMLQPGGVGVLLNNAGAPSTKTSLAASVNPVTVNQPVTYTATVKGRSRGTLHGTVVFTDGPYVIGEVPLSKNRASVETSYDSAGAHSIIAVYSGDLDKHAGSVSQTLTETVH